MNLNMNARSVSLQPKGPRLLLGFHFVFAIARIMTMIPTRGRGVRPEAAQGHEQLRQLLPGLSVERDSDHIPMRRSTLMPSPGIEFEPSDDCNN